MKNDLIAAVDEVRSHLNPKYHLDLKKLKGNIDPYSELGAELLDSEDRIKL